MQGTGKYTHTGGDVYEGELLHGQKHGVGKLSYRNGDVYYGQFAAGKEDGLGVYTSKSSNVFEGRWSQGSRQDGEGKMEYNATDSSVYQGQWRNCERHGRGCITFSDGTSRKTDWCNDREAFQAKGFVKYANGDVYEGELVNSLRH